MVQKDQQQPKPASKVMHLNLKKVGEMKNEEKISKAVESAKEAPKPEDSAKVQELAQNITA